MATQFDHNGGFAGKGDAILDTGRPRTLVDWLEDQRQQAEECMAIFTGTDTGHFWRGYVAALQDVQNYVE